MNPLQFEVERLLGIIVRNGEKYQAVRDELLKARADRDVYKRWYEQEKLRADTLQLKVNTDPAAGMFSSLFGGKR